MITIKKYPNRRLYDTSKSEYINVDDILVMVQNHLDFEILDSKSGEDQTKSILLQIISEQEVNESRSLLTNTLLKQLIRFYNSDMQPYVRSYLEQSLAGLLEQQEAMQLMVNNLVKSSPANMFTKMMEENMKLWGAAAPGPKKDDK